MSLAVRVLLLFIFILYFFFFSFAIFAIWCTIHKHKFIDPLVSNWLILRMLNERIRLRIVAPAQYNIRNIHDYIRTRQSTISWVCFANFTVFHNNLILFKSLFSDSFSVARWFYFILFVACFQYTNNRLNTTSEQHHRIVINHTHSPWTHRKLIRNRQRNKIEMKNVLLPESI